MTQPKHERIIIVTLKEDKQVNINVKFKESLTYKVVVKNLDARKKLFKKLYKDNWEFHYYSWLAVNTPSKVRKYVSWVNGFGE